MKKYIIFDVDRTIINSYESEMISLQEAIINVTGNGKDKTELIKLTTLPTDQFFDNLNLSNEQINLIHKEWSNTLEKYQTICFPGIKDVIKKLDKDGYIIGIVTSRTMDEFLELKEEFSDIMDKFKAIVTSDKVKKPKPNIESMKYICRELKCKNEDIIYIGDSRIDWLFSINSGCTFIPAVWENKELIDIEHACLNVRDILKVIDLINK